MYVDEFSNCLDVLTCVYQCQIIPPAEYTIKLRPILNGVMKDSLSCLRLFTILCIGKLLLLLFQEND